MWERIISRTTSSPSSTPPETTGGSTPKACSKSRGGDKVEIDYVEKKHVKKPGGARPGFVVYYTNYSLVIDSDISGLTLAED